MSIGGRVPSGCSFHPQACDPGAGNQNGSVESLVKWVKGNFLLGRSFVDEADLSAEIDAWCARTNARPSDATGEPPDARLAAEAAQGGALPPAAQDDGLLGSGQVSRESLVAVSGNRYSVPVNQVGASVTVRLHRDRLRIWRDLVCLADHPRAADGARKRVIDPAHFTTLFAAKPRAQAMLYRGLLVELGGHAPAFVSELSYRQRDCLCAQLIAVYALYEQHGALALLAAMDRAVAAGTYQVEALERLLASPPTSALPVSVFRLAGAPPQQAIDRALSVYEAWVEIDVALPEVIG